MAMTDLRPCFAALLLGTALAVAGCAAPVPRPAMVAQAATGDFGYSETVLPGNRYEVVYRTPRLRTAVAATAREEDLAAEKQRAYDLALWRAAQLALEQGYSSLTVEEAERDADILVRREPDTLGYWPNPWFHPYRFGRYPWWPGFHPYHGGFGYRSWASARVTARLVVAFHDTAVDDGLDAAATAERLARQYGAAAYPG